MKLSIKEVYDGRLPEYQVLDKDNNIIRIFDTIEEAQIFVNESVTTCCGEEDPCD